MLSLRDVTVLWLHEGLTPSSGAFDKSWSYPVAVPRQPFETNITAAVQHVIDNKEVYKRERLMPWLHVGTGDGTAVLNHQGILAFALTLGII